jgi:hypothetical protein
MSILERSRYNNPSTPVECRAWAAAEFSDFSCGDKRLKDRLIVLASNMLSRPTASLNAASEDWHSAKGTYRFLANKNATLQAILEAQRIKTLQRISECDGDILLIQDTTDIVLTHHPATKGLGKITKCKTNILGIHVHSVLCVTESGLPLGLLYQKHYAHQNMPDEHSETKEIVTKKDESDKGASIPTKSKPTKSSKKGVKASADGEKKKRSMDYKKKSIDEKESFRWIEWLDLITANEDLKSRAICMGDRECDIFEFINEVNARGLRYIVRNCHNRRSVELDKLSDNGKIDTEIIGIRDAVANSSSLGTAMIQCRDKVTKEEFVGKFEVKACTRSILPPANCPKSRATFLPERTSIVHIRQLDCAPDCEPIEWFLFTNEPCGTLDECLRVVKLYTQRWHIENFHRVLKSGMAVEEARLCEAASMSKLIAVASATALRIYWMQHLARVHPDDSCKKVLSEDEWKALFAFIGHGKPLPLQPPTVKDAVREIAKLGGFMARKADGDPGMMTIWRGWIRLQDIVATWRVVGAYQQNIGD